jgi:iron(III) transport system ATP-binding protein
MTKLSVENLFLDFGSHEILKDVSVVLERGEVLVLLGPSGSGKTTLLRAIAGLELPKRGRIKIDDQLMFDGASKLEVPAEQRNLGFVFQSYGLWPHRTVFDNVAYGLRLRKLPTAEVERRTRKALDELGLGDLSRRYPHQLSGGQQQRVAIARSLVYQPPVILMDEPLSNLDAKLREEAKSWLRGLIVELQLSAVVVTHDQSEAMAMADRIVLLSAGRVEQEGPPEQIYNSRAPCSQPSSSASTTAWPVVSSGSTTARRCSPGPAGGSVATPARRCGRVTPRSAWSGSSARASPAPPATTGSR